MSEKSGLVMDRRSVVKKGSAAALLGASGLVGSAIAATEYSESLEERLMEAAAEAAKKNNGKDIENVTEKRFREITDEEGLGNGVHVSHTQYEVEDLGIADPDDDEDRDELQAHQRFSESAADFTEWATDTYHPEGDVFVGFLVEFKEVALRPRVNKPWYVKDGCGINYDNNDWSQVGTGNYGSDVHDVDWYSGSPGDHASAFEVELATERQVTATGSYRKVPKTGHVTNGVNLKLEGTPSTVGVNYGHTYAETPMGSLDITASAGAFDVGVDGTIGDEAFTLSEPVDPSEYV